MVLEMTVAVAAQVMAVTASGLSWFSFAAVVDAAMEMTAVVAVDANSNHSLSFQNDAGTYDMYISREIVNDDGKGIGPLILAFSEALLIK